MKPKLRTFDFRKLSNLKLGSLKLEISYGNENVKFNIFGSIRDFQLHFSRVGPPSTPLREGGAEVDQRKVKLEISYGTENVKLEAGNLEWNRKCQTLNFEN